MKSEDILDEILSRLTEREAAAWRRGAMDAYEGIAERRETHVPITLAESEVYRAESLSWLDSIPSSVAYGIVTDSPYSSGGAFRGDRVSATNAKYISSSHLANYDHEFAGDNRDQRSWAFWTELWMRKAYRVARTGGVMVSFVDWRQLATMTDAVQAAGWVLRGIVPWDKTESSRPTTGRFRAQCEYIVWASKGELPLSRDAPVLPGCLRFSVGRNKTHPTEKPVDMLRVACRIVERGGLIVDPFAGSGAHGEAALLEGHPFLGCEIVPAYAEAADARVKATIADLQNRPTLFDLNESPMEQTDMHTTTKEEE